VNVNVCVCVCACVCVRVSVRVCACVCLRVRMRLPLWCMEHTCASACGCDGRKHDSQLTVFLHEILINVFIRLLTKFVDVGLVCTGSRYFHVLPRAK
jgi:hypothetical protein